MSTLHLLDANALIALSITDHEHHARAASWVAAVDRIALCPIVEGSLIRFLVRLGEHRDTALRLLAGLYASGRCEFWSDSLSYTDADLGQVVGHRQVTDAYLTALAQSRHAKLATLDRALAAARPDHVDLIP